MLRLIHMKTSLYIQAATCQNHTPRTPVWMMRQAGRYLESYQKFRRNYRFLDMIKTPDIAAAITLQPIEQFGFDAAILFSDILVTAEAMGAELQFIEKIGPKFTHPLRRKVDIKNLSTTDIDEKLSYVYQAIKQTKTLLEPFKTPLIGFAGAPFTVASYMIEGQSSPDLKNVKQYAFQNPDLMHLMLEKLTTVTITYLNSQIAAGVDALQLFDSWANALSWEDFNEFCFPYIKKIIEALQPTDIPITVFCRGSSVFYPLLAKTGANVVGLDWNCDLDTVRQTITPPIALQGNLDPYLLYAPETVLKKRVQDIIQARKDDPGFIFNLGHGIMPDMSPDAVRLVVETIREIGHA